MGGEASSVCTWPCSAAISGSEYGKKIFLLSSVSPGSAQRLACSSRLRAAMRPRSRGTRARRGPGASLGFGLPEKAARPAEAWGGPAPWDRRHRPSLRAGAAVAIETSLRRGLVRRLPFCCSWRRRGPIGTCPRVRAPAGTGGGLPGDARRPPPFWLNQRHSF